MKNASRVRRAAVAAATIVFLAPLLAASWPQWRGPQRDGVSKESGLLHEWPKEGPKVAWQMKDLGTGYSAPAVAEGRVFLLGNKGIESEFVQALDAKTGATIWSRDLGKVGNPKQVPSYPAARSTATVDGAKVYALGSDGDLACLQADSGKIVWQKNLRTDFGGEPGTWAYSESPLVDGDAVVCTPGGIGAATIIALNKNTGETVWKSAIEGGDQAAYSSIVPAEIAGVKQYVQFLQKGLVGVDAATGKMLWRYDHTGAGSPANIPTPVVHGDYVYSASGRGGGGLVKVTAKDGEFKADEVYFEPNLPKSIGGAVIVDDYMYGTNSDSLMCVELATGEVKWKDRAIGAASLCFADGDLYLHGENGDVALVKATPERYQEKGRFTPANPPDRGQSKAWAYPAVADGKLYIFDYGTLWCYDIAGEGG